MSDIVLTVEGLTKKYTIGENRERYVALRDALVRGARNIGSSVTGGRLRRVKGYLYSTARSPRHAEERHY